MKGSRIMVLLAACLLAVKISANEVEWKIAGSGSSTANVNWLAVTTPAVSDAQELTLNSFNISISASNSTTSYMLISTSNESATSVAASNVVAVSTNNPKPGSGYTTYNFDGAKLKPSTTYYLYWVSSKTTYTATTQRLKMAKTSYSPGIYFGNTLHNDYCPNFQTTLTYTPEGGGSEDPPVPEVEQQIIRTSTNDKPYRIPAIAQAYNGDVIFIDHDLVCQMDPGWGEVDCYARVSTDGGATWGEPVCIADGNGIDGDFANCYGDAAVVADRESNNILVLLVTGHVKFVDSNRNNPIRVACVRGSYDNAAKQWVWQSPVDITSTIYGLLPNTKSLFVTSGKICQSRQIKVGNHYRIYCGLDTRPVSGTSNLNHNYVLYSDDFGKTWNVLGGTNNPAITSGDECKCEELPNGNVVLSSRVKMGRIFNIYTYTNQGTGAGSWGTQRNPVSSDNGVYNGNDTSPCNGEILMVDAIRNSDGEKVTLALQSISFSRKILYIYYKELSATTDYNTAANFAKNWDGRYLVVNNSACYSTMVRQRCDRIGFCYEDNITSNTRGYDLIYCRYPLEAITNNRYSLAKEVPVITGDINLDGSVTVADVTMLVDYILGKQPIPCYEQPSDVNGDHEVNIADVTSLVDIILGKASE